MKIAENKSLTAAVASLVAVFAFGAAGCSDRTEQAASNAAQGAAQDAQNHAAAAGQAVENAGDKVAQETQEAAAATAKAADRAGDEIAEKAGEAKEAIGGAAANVAKETQDAGQVVTLTPKVKNALVGNDQLDATNINVETDGEKNVVMLKGSVKSQKEKDLATKVAKQALMDAKSTFKLQNDLTVGGAR